MSAIPVVKHANITILPERDGLKLPGNTTAAYSCLSGYELENPDNNIAKCEYALENLAGRPFDPIFIKITVIARPNAVFSVI